jgi:hypothetical protein
MPQTFWHLLASRYSVQQSVAVPLPEFISGSGEGDITGRSAVAEDCYDNKYFIVLRIMSNIVRFAL